MQAVDSPGIGLVESNSEEAVSFRATMYFMWTPTAASQCTGSPSKPCVIPVPLGSVAWGFSGEAINTLSSTAGVSGTTWTLNQCSAGTAGQFQRSNGAAGYPTWTTEFINH